MNWPKKSIEGKIRKSLLGYTIFIVVLLWTFQIAFINTYYQTMQQHEHPAGRKGDHPQRRAGKF